MKNVFLFANLFALILVASCKKQPEPVADISTRTEVLANIGQNVIVENFVSFQSDANGLVDAVDTYIADSTSTAKLLILQNAWFRAAVTWKNSALFTIGPVNDALAARYIDGRPDIDAIEKFISNTSIPVNNATVEPLGPETRGLNVIEYLIYGYNRNNNFSVISSFTGVNGQRRCAFLRALSRSVRDKANALIVYWSHGGSGYVKDFAASTGNERMASISILVRRLIEHTASLREKRLGLPLGIQTGKPAPELVDARFSNQSLIMLQSELECIYSVLSGNSAISDSPPGPGIYELLAPGRESEDELVKRIDSQFSAAASARANMRKPLAESIISDPTAVKELYNTIGNLVTTLETDLVERLKAKGVQM